MKQTPVHLITHSHLLSSTIDEDPNATAYNAGTAYAFGDEVYKDEAGEHKVYRSAQGSNTGNDPSTDDGTWWVEIGWTNRWKALKPSTGLATVADDNTGIQWKLNITSTCTHVGLFGVKAASVTVLVEDESAVEVFNETRTATETVDGVSWYVDKMVFSDVGIEAGYDVTITIADTGVSGEVARVSQVVIGRTVDLGEVTEGDLSDTLEDFSRREQDTDGIFEVTVRGYSEMATYAFSHAPEMTRWVRDRLIGQRSWPCMYWVDSASVDKGMMIFGYAQEPNTPADLGTCVTVVDVRGIAYQAPGITSLIPIDALPPEGFTSSDWSLASGGTSSLNGTITSVDAIATDIEYQYRIAGSGDPWSTATSTGGVSGFSISTLTDDTEYDVRIRPTNDAGDGDWSAPKTATTDSYLYARVLAERDFSTDNMLSSEYITFAVDSAYTEIQIISQGIGDGTATSPQMTIEVSDDGGATWETGAYEDGYIRGGSYVQLGGSGNPQTRMFSSTIFGSGGGVTRIFNMDSGVKPHTNTFTRDSTNMFARISTLDNSAITHWRLTANADVTGGFIKLLGVLA